MRKVVALLGEADQFEHLGHLGRDHVLRSPDHLERERDVLEDGLVGQEAEVLEHAADVPAEVGDPPSRQVADLLTGLPDPAGVGHLLPQQEADERGLARPGGSDEEDELTLVDLDRAVGESDRGALVRLGDVLERDHGQRIGADVGGIGGRTTPPGTSAHPSESSLERGGSPCDLGTRGDRSSGASGAPKRPSGSARPGAPHDGSPVRSSLVARLPLTRCRHRGACYFVQLPRVGSYSVARRVAARRRSSASMKSSRSPSSTASTLPVS